MSLAFGEMGLTPSQFYTMTPAEFFLTLRGFNDKAWKVWRHTRLIAYTTYATTPRKKGKFPVSMLRWLPLPIDKKNQDLTPVDKMNAVFAFLAEKAKNTNPNG